MVTEERNTEASKLRAVRNLYLDFEKEGFKMQVYGNDREQAEKAITLAITGIDHVIEAIAKYKDFITATKSNITLAHNDLKNMHQLGSTIAGGRLDQNKKETFIGAFKSSFFVWTGLAYLGGKGANLLSQCHGEALSRLSFKGSLNREEQLQSAQREMQQLSTSITNRADRIERQAQDSTTRMNNPQMDAEDAQNFTNTRNQNFAADF